MPPKIEWPPEAELREVFQRYADEGCTEREDQIERFQRDYSRLNASNRSVLDLIRSLENNTGRVLETIRSRDARERAREASVTPPPRTTIELRSPHRRVASSTEAATSVRGTRLRVSTSKSRQKSSSPVPRSKLKGKQRAQSLTEPEDSEVEDPDQLTASTSRTQTKMSPRRWKEVPVSIPKEEHEKMKSLVVRLKEKIVALEEEKSGLNDRYYADIGTWTDKNVELDRENTSLTGRLQEMDRKLESADSRFDAETKRLAEEIKFWKDRSLYLEGQLEEYRTLVTDAKVEIGRYKAERDQAREMLGLPTNRRPDSSSTVPIGSDQPSIRQSSATSARIHSPLLPSTEPLRLTVKDDDTPTYSQARNIENLPAHSGPLPPMIAPDSSPPTTISSESSAHVRYPATSSSMHSTLINRNSPATTTLTHSYTYSPYTYPQPLYHPSTQGFNPQPQPQSPAYPPPPPIPTHSHSHSIAAAAADTSYPGTYHESGRGATQTTTRRYPLGKPTHEFSSSSGPGHRRETSRSLSVSESRSGSAASVSGKSGNGPPRGQSSSLGALAPSGSVQSQGKRRHTDSPGLGPYSEEGSSRYGAGEQSEPTSKRRRLP